MIIVIRDLPVAPSCFPFLKKYNIENAKQFQKRKGNQQVKTETKNFSFKDPTLKASTPSNVFKHNHKQKPLANHKTKQHKIQMQCSLDFLKTNIVVIMKRD